MDSLYPAGPSAVPATLTQPTKQYKQRAWWAVASLLLFAAIYFALLVWFGWTAWRLVGTGVNSHSGFGLIVLGICSGFLALFMAKALVFVRRGGAPDDIELTSASQPELFAFLHKLADDAGAPRPARVFVSPRVNAAVFYDLTILNFIFPSRKNLEIGLGLVNVLTLSELKAVLAHEFGHFAQRSMAIGSWVYIAQQIAGHVIARRDALDRFLAGLSRVDLRIAWVGWILQLIVWSIRSLLDTVFRVVVLAQRALSRQMEFQADLVAVSLTGSDELVHALHKLQAADTAWDRTISFANAEAREGRAVADLFTVQAAIIDKMARILGEPDYGRVPQARGNAPAKRRVFTSGFAQPPQMWSTHPANHDREENAKRHYLPAPHDGRSAWVLFRDAERLRTRVSAHLVKELKLQVAAPELTQQQLDERYSLLQYLPLYRGAYLGRTLTRHCQEPRELFEAAALADADVRQALSALYPDSLKDDLSRLRSLEEELALLEALRDKVYEATGGQLTHRGQPITRRQLPDAIRRVGREAEKVRQRILAHDRECRSAHLAAAARLGAGWPEYLRGLISLLHYAEHTLANVQDAHGLLGNTVAIVTADGKVSAAELKRLLAVANELHAVLAQAFGQRDQLILGPVITGRLKTGSWGALLEEFQLPPATEGNVNEWMRAIDGWVRSLSGPLSALATAALEELLATEAKVARLLRQGTPEPAPTAPRVPAQYPRLLPGKERKRQKKLGLWDRFQTADGVLPAAARLVVAGAIVGTVLSVGGLAGANATVTIYNGLGTAVSVRLGDKSVTLPRFGSETVEVPHEGTLHVQTTWGNGATIEEFDPEIADTVDHYVYNVAAASPIVEWTAVYGSAQETPPRMLGTARWQESSADFYFVDPPDHVSTKGGGATRTVLSGAGERAPEDLMRVPLPAPQRLAMAQAHARWDDATAPHTAEWKVLAAQLATP